MSQPPVADSIWRRIPALAAVDIHIRNDRLSVIQEEEPIGFTWAEFEGIVRVYV
jgi:hypothetical protein